MKQYFLLISFLFLFDGITWAQEPYGRVRIEVMPDGTRKAVLVNEGKQSFNKKNKKSKSATPRVQTINGPLLNIKVETEKEWDIQEEKRESSLSVPEPIQLEIGRSVEREVREPVSAFPESVPPPADYLYFQPYTIMEEEYDLDQPIEENFSIAVHYELIPSSGFSDLGHNAGLQLTVDNFVLDGFIGFGNINYDLDNNKMSESYTSYGANLGYKMRVAPRFHIYPLVGIIKCETISDKLTYNYGIGLHYFFNKRFFLSYKFTRYTNGLGIGFSMNN